MGAITRLVEQVAGASADHLLAEGDEGGEQILEVQELRPAGVERHEVAAEGRLQLGEAIELVQHDIGHGVALQLDHHAIAFTIGFVANLGDALDLLLAHQFADALDHRGLVDLIGDVRDDQRLATAAHRLGADATAHGERTATGRIGRADAGAPENEAAGGEIGARNQLDQVLDRHFRPIDQRDRGVDHLAEIVRRDVGRHADGDAAGAVDQQIGEAGGKDDRLALGVVVVRLEVDGVFVDVLEQLVGGLGETHFGVSHRRGGVAVDRAEVALAVDQRQAHREVLRHAHQRVVDRLIAVRMVLTDDVADHAGRLAIGLVPVVAVLVHREENAPVDGLEAVARVGKGTADDHAHGVIEVAALHLVGDRDRLDVGGIASRGGIVSAGQGRLSSFAKSLSTCRVRLHDSALESQSKCRFSKENHASRASFADDCGTRRAPRRAGRVPCGEIAGRGRVGEGWEAPYARAKGRGSPVGEIGCSTICSKPSSRCS